MEQLNLLDWSSNDKTEIIYEAVTKDKKDLCYILGELEPLFKEIDSKEINPSTISKALSHCQKHYQDKIQNSILKPS